MHPVRVPYSASVLLDRCSLDSEALVDGNGRDDAGAGGLPWSSLFDPVANAKALGDVRAHGLRAASDLVERLVRSVRR